MNRRTRFLSGLVLLVTMSVSVAETVWAAACAPDMGSMAASATTTTSMEGMDDMPADHDCMPGHEHDRQQRGDNGPACPFSPAGAAQGCAASALLPSPVPPLSSPSHTDVVLPPSDDASPRLLRTASIFHPPKL
jgi:uncharacterized protein involved in copper resistance